MRTKEETYKKTITKLERQMSQAKEGYERQSSKKDIENQLAFDQDSKKYKNKITELEQSLQSLKIDHKNILNKTNEELESRLKKLQSRCHEAQAKRDEQLFSKRKN